MERCELWAQGDFHEPEFRAGNREPAADDRARLSSARRGACGRATGVPRTDAPYPLQFIPFSSQRRRTPNRFLARRCEGLDCAA